MTTEGNTLLQLHNESVEKIITLLREESERTSNPTPASIADTIDSQFVGDDEHQREEAPALDRTRYAVGFCGLPGAGKDFAAQTLADAVSIPHVSMSDAMRARLPPRFEGQDLQTVGAKLEEEEPEFAGNATLEAVGELDAEVVAISGVRSITDYRVLNCYFEEFVLVRVEAPFYTRLERLRERGRDDEEADMSAHDLVDRDTHERENLGYDKLNSHEDEWADQYLPGSEYGIYDTSVVDIAIHNGSNVIDLDRCIRDIIKSIEWLGEPAHDSIQEWLDELPP